MKATANDPIHKLKAVLAEHLPWHGARIGFLARFLLALRKVRSVDLAELATGFGGQAQGSRMKLSPRGGAAYSCHPRRPSFV